MSRVVKEAEGGVPLVFRLYRIKDGTGVSGEGVVAWGTQFPDGRCAVRWNTEFSSTVAWDSIDHLMYVHGHGGDTILHWWSGTEWVWEL